MEKRRTDKNVLKPFEDQLLCRICSNLYNDCFMTLCGHNFCSACIKQRLSTDGDCPDCYEIIREKDLKSNKLLDKLVCFYKKVQRCNGLDIDNQRKTCRISAHPDSDIQIVSVQGHHTAVNSLNSTTSQNFPVNHFSASLPIKQETAACNKADRNNVVMPTKTAKLPYGKNKKYAVVEFSQSNSVEIIPVEWLINSHITRWPSKMSILQLSKFIRECASPKPSWDLFDINILGSYRTFKKAHKKVKEAENNSRLGEGTSSSHSKVEKKGNTGKRKKQAPARYRTAESSDEDIPGCPDESPPKKKKIPVPTSGDHGSCLETSGAASTISIQEIPNAETNKCLMHTNTDLETQNHIPFLPLLSQIFSELEKINKSISEMAKNQGELHSQLMRYQVALGQQPINTQVTMPIPDIELPLKTNEDLMNLNQILAENESLPSRLVSYLSNIAYGKSLSYFTTVLLKKLMSREVAMQYSRLGRKGKKSLEELKEVYNVLLATMGLKFPDHTREDLAERLGKVLSTAREWYNSKFKVRQSSLEIAEI